MPFGDYDQYSEQELLAIIASGMRPDGAVASTATTAVLSNALTTTAASAFPSQACRMLTVENPSSNSVDILVGNVGSELLRLAPGEGRPFRCTNANQISAKNASTATQTVYGIAEVPS